MTTKGYTFRHFVLALTAVTITVLAAAVQAQNAAPGQDKPRQRAAQEMMTGRRQMMAEMQASQKKLDELVAAMNAAKGPDKLERIAAVVNELASQHTRMSARMMSMQGGMISHMRMGTSGPGKEPTEPSGDVDHSQHHPENNTVGR